MSATSGAAAPAGELTLVKHAGRKSSGPVTIRQILRACLPQRRLPAEVNRWRARNAPRLLLGLAKLLVARAAKRVSGIPLLEGALYLTLVRGDGRRIPLGLASLRVVTDAGAGFIVDALQNLVEAENMKFHGFGTGTTAEAATQTALVTEETTQYNPDSTRPTGSQTENGAKVYRTVGTYTPDSGGTRAITEHAILSQAATGGGVMLDRSVFSVVNLDSAAGDSLEATYDLTVNSGG